MGNNTECVLSIRIQLQDIRVNVEIKTDGSVTLVSNAAKHRRPRPLPVSAPAGVTLVLATFSLLIFFVYSYKYTEYKYKEELKYRKMTSPHENSFYFCVTSAVVTVKIWNLDLSAFIFRIRVKVWKITEEVQGQ